MHEIPVVGVGLSLNQAGILSSDLTISDGRDTLAPYSVGDATADWADRQDGAALVGLSISWHRRNVVSVHGVVRLAHQLPSDNVAPALAGRVSLASHL